MVYIGILWLILAPVFAFLIGEAIHQANLPTKEELIQKGYKHAGSDLYIKD
jgi:multisubunit Na+/H+ antiporter MnhG subunit